MALETECLRRGELEAAVLQRQWKFLSELLPLLVLQSGEIRECHKMNCATLRVPSLRLFSMNKGK